MSHLRLFFTSFPEAAAEGTEVTLSPEDSHHLATVLRAHVGETVLVADKQKRQQGSAKIEALTPVVRVTLLGVVSANASHSPIGMLIFALGRAPVNDLICEKATELGARRLLFFNSERSETKITHDDFQKKRVRWEKISASAAKQCAQPHTPELLFAETLEEIEVVLQKNALVLGPRLLCSLGEQTQPLRSIPPPALPVTLAVGPAGDFTNAELTYLKANNFSEVTLGKNTLRSETAAITAMAQVIGLWG